MENGFCNLTKILSSQSDSHKNQPKKCKLSWSSFKVKETTFIFHFYVQLKSKGYLSNSIQRRVCSMRYVSRHTTGITGTGLFGKFGTRHQYQLQKLQ